MNKELVFERRGQIVLITINRPAQRNAMNEEVRLGLFEAFQQFEEDDSLRCAILTGSGDKAFCAGMDLKMMAALPDKPLPSDYLPVIGRSVKLRKPTICAVNGDAVAGGWLFAQMSDLCVAADHARFGITEARMGLGMSWAASLIHMIPQRMLMELMLTGELINARRAMEIGFVNRVVSSGQLLATAMQMAEQICANAPLSVEAAREVVHLSTEMGSTAALLTAKHVFERVYKSKDAIEGPKAFVEKRKPRWQGR